MTALVKIQRKGQMTLPSRFRSAVGVAEGDLIELSVQRGRIVLTPKIVVDRSQFPNADDEYTPAERRAIDRDIAKSLKEYRQGKAIGPFATPEAFIASLRTQSKKPVTRKT